MGYFPMCVEITGRPVILVGSGGQIREKTEKLLPFSPQMIHLEHLTKEDLQVLPVFVVVGDVDETEAEKAAELCALHRIPINVVDKPRLCTFTFPALIVRGDLSVSISTAGKSPAAAALLRKRIEPVIPDKTDQILDWISRIRIEIREKYPPQQSKEILKEMIAEGLNKDRPLTRDECADIAARHERQGLPG